MSKLDIDNACSSSAGEAVGTTSLAAASCNLGHLDNIANSELLSDVNRVGVTRDTVAGFQSKVNLALREAELSFGFVVAGTFSAGYVIENYNQLGQDASGDNWRYRGATLPFTVVPGTIPALPDFEEIEFSAASGITYGTGTVEDALDSLTDGSGTVEALNMPYIFATLSDLVSSNIVFPPGKKLVTIANNTDTNAGGADYEVLTIAQYPLKSNLTLPDGELNAGILIGSDFYLNSGTALVARRIQKNNDINVYEFGYRGIGVIDNGPTTIATPDPTKDESPSVAKVLAYIQRGSPQDIGASSAGIVELQQKGAYNIVFPERSIYNASAEFPYYNNNINIYFNNTEVRPFTPMEFMARRSFNTVVSQLRVNWEVFNTDEEIYEAHLLGNDAISIGGPRTDPAVPFPLDTFSRYIQCFSTGGWQAFDTGNEGIIFNNAYEGCRAANPLGFGFDIGDNAFISTTCIMDQPFVRLTKRDTVQHGGFVFRALQHMSATSPQTPPATAVSSEYWQIGLNSDGTPESPSGQDAWASGTFYRAFGKHYKLTNVSTLSMVNPSADGGTDQSPTFEFTGINLSIDHFHLEKHQKVFSDRLTFDIQGGQLDLGLLYLAECQITNEGNSVVERGGILFSCRVGHTSSSVNEPTVGADWFDFWDQLATTPTTQAAWVSGTSYTTGDGTLIGSSTNARGLTVNDLDQRLTALKSGRIKALDGANVPEGRVTTEKLPDSSLKNMGGMISLRGFPTALSNIVRVSNPTSTFTIRPRAEQNGAEFQTSLAEVGVMTAQIDGSVSAGTKFGFDVSDTTGNIDNISGQVVLSGINGAFFTGPTTVRNGTLWVQKRGEATDGSANSWRTWVESGGSMSGEFTVESIMGTQRVSGGVTGTYITIPAVSGKRIKLSALSADAPQTNLTSIFAGSTEIVNDVNLDIDVASATLSNEFAIGSGQNEIISGVGESITVVTNVATSTAVRYQYQIGT